MLIGDTYDKATNLHTKRMSARKASTATIACSPVASGKVTADTVTVDIVAQGSPKQKTFHKQIPLDGDQAVASFDMQNGRRTESLKDVQAANAVQGQMALGNQILAQQLSSASDPTVTPTDPYLNPNLFLAAVGYQPVIITLPTGRNMSATSVVSHDRRYVRITAQPMFSTIPEVNTFNYAAGSSGTSGGTGSGQLAIRTATFSGERRG